MHKNLRSADLTNGIDYLLLKSLVNMIKILSLFKLFQSGDQSSFDLFTW